MGRQISEGFYLRAGETEIRSEDVQVWAEKKEDRVSLSLYCEKLLPLMKDDSEKAWWLAYTLTDQVLGEVYSIALIDDLNLVEQPNERASTLLSALRKTLRDMGYRLWDDAQDYLDNSYISYELKPVEDPDADWRLDVYTGSNRLPVLINEYMGVESDVMDDYHRDRIVAGFLCYPLAGFEGEKRAERILPRSETPCKKPFKNTPGMMLSPFLEEPPACTMGI